MPKTPFQFEISTAKPAAIIFADSFLTKPIARLLRSKGLRIRKKPGLVDYVIDCFGSAEAIYLAQKSNAKYLRLIQDHSPSPHLENLNWRIVRTGLIVGPEMPESDPLAQPIIAAVKNKVLVIPFPPENKIFLLHPNDLAQAIWQALVLPGTSEKEFPILGQETIAKDLADFLQQLGQTDKGIRFLPDPEIIDFSPQQGEEVNQQLNWQPSYSWQQAVEDAFQFFWKKIKPEKPKIIPEEPEEETMPIEIAPPEKIETKDEEKAKIEIAETPKPEKKEEELIVVEEIDDQEPEEEAEIEKIISHFKEPELPPQQPKRKVGWTKIILALLATTVLSVLVVWSKPLIALALGAQYLKQGLNQLQTQSWTESESSIKKAKSYFRQGENFLKNSRLNFLFFGLEQDLGKAAEIGRKTTSAIQTAIPLAQNSLAMLEAILKDRPYDFEKGVQEISRQEKELSAQLATIEALLSSPWQYLPPRWRQSPYQWREKIKELRLALAKGEKLINYLPWIIGADGQRRTFLVLLQNNMELRPTGGFIGSFALLTFEDGVLTNFEVKDVYVADGQLKGYVEPPKQIKEILGEETWYLRDANWNPDFPKTARNTEWFLRKELGREVDGVIGFNLEAAKKLIAAFGEIYLPDFNEKINANNLFERAEFWAENKFFPGSTQKMAFLGLLGRQLFENIKAAQPEEYLKIGQAILAALEEKEILIYVHQPQLAKNLYQLNWDGSIKKPHCNLNPCFTDYLYLVEANLGVNKANYFLRRSLEQSIDFREDGQINHQLKINYENTAVSSNWPGGNYVNWLRIYLPLQTKIEEIVITDPLNPQNRTVIGSDQREEEIKDGKEVIGFLVRVPIKQRRTVTIRFSQRANIKGETFGYLLYWQKQSGYQNTPVSLLISFPQSWQPVQVNPAASLVSGKLLFNQQLEKDLTFGVEFSR